MVIVLVETQRTMADVCEISPSNGSIPAGPMASGRLSFMAWPVHSTTDDESESQHSHPLRSQGGQERGLGVILEVDSEDLESGYHY